VTAGKGVSTMKQGTTQKDSTKRALNEYYEMIEKERASGGKIVFFKRLVITQAANNWRAAHPQK